MQLKIGYLFQCPPWARGFCPFRACGAYLRASGLSGRMGQNLRKFSFFIILKRTNYDRRQKLREGRARHALLSHRYPQGSAQPAGEMDQPVPRAQAEPLFGLRRQVFPLLHPATSSRNHRISG